MKFGMRMPSMKKRVSANLSVPRVWSHSVGVKAPRGMGMATDSKKYVYNGIYRNTSFSVDRPEGDYGEQQITTADIEKGYRDDKIFLLVSLTQLVFVLIIVVGGLALLGRFFYFLHTF